MLTEHEIVQKYLSEGHIEKAKEEAAKAGFHSLVGQIDKSLEFTRSKETYGQYYKQDWDGLERRIPGDQLRAGWNLDDRQTEAAKQIASLSPKNFLDIGCADGSLIFNLLHRGIVQQAWGVDPWVSGVAWAEQYGQEFFKGKASWFCGLIEDWNPPSEKMDAIHLGEILEHVLDPAVIVKKAATLLSASGALVITVPVSRPGISAEEHAHLISGKPNQHIRHIELQQLIEYGLAAGLKLKKCETIGTRWVNLIATLAV